MAALASVVDVGWRWSVRHGSARRWQWRGYAQLSCLTAQIVEHIGGDTTHLLALWVAARDAEDEHRSFPVIAPHTGRPAGVATGTPVVTVSAVVTVDRLRAGFARLNIRYTIDPADESLLALWERHSMLAALEGPSDEILVLRCRPNATVAPRQRHRARDQSTSGTTPSGS